MNALAGLAILLVLQTCGELLARALALPFPGPVIGPMLLPLSRCAQVRVQTRGSGGRILLAHLSRYSSRSALV